MAKNRPELDMLASVDLFQGLTRKELDAVHAMSREQSFPAGAVVAAEGAAAGRFYLIVEGKATVITGGEMVEPREVGPGEVRAKATNGGTPHELGEGDVLAIPSGVPHQFTEVSDPFLYFVVKVEA